MPLINSNFKPNAKLYSLQVPGDNMRFPEVSEGYVASDGVGLAISGGGSRSLSLTCGYLRGFHSLREQCGFKEFDYISSVSGGSWATSIYCFANESTVDLVGAETTPEQLSLEFLDSSTPGKMGEVISDKHFKAIKMLARQYFCNRTPVDKVWSEMIEECILREFDLDNCMIAVNEGHLEFILRRNKHLKRKKFRVLAKGRPFPIINCTLLGPEGYSSGMCHNFQATPLYSGIPFYKNLDNSTYYRVNPVAKYLNFCSKYKPLPELKLLTVGGGFVETFAINSAGPLKRKKRYFNAEQQTSETIKMQSFNTKNVYTLGDMIGASSAAFGAQLSNLGVGDIIIPKIKYFPLHSTVLSNLGYKQDAKSLQIADGGIYENTGVLSLLQRGLRKIVCLMNTATPLDLECDGEKFLVLDYSQKPPDIKYKAAATDLLALFGEVPVTMETDDGFNYTSNMVFAQSSLKSVFNGLVTSCKAGKGAVYRTILEVLPNQAWNIVGGFDVDITFVYNAVVNNFEDKLPNETKEALGQKEHGDFKNFPFYKTVNQSKSVFSLSTPQIVLAAAQAEYVIKANMDIFCPR